MGTSIFKQHLWSLAVILMLLSATGTAKAHECILEGNTPVQISKYNTCKNDLLNGTAGHQQQDDQARLLQLEEENRQLKARLEFLRSRLLGLLSTF